MNTELLDVKEAADFLGLNEQTVRRLARDHQIPAFKYGGSWRFKKEQLSSFGKKNEVQKTDSAKAKILLVDDDPGVIRVMQECLEYEGHQVFTCFNGEKVIESTEGISPDLIFLDLQMPLYSGPKTLRLILGEWGSVETIILTAFPDSELMQEVIDLSPVRLLKKPPELSVVLELVRKHFIV